MRRWPLLGVLTFQVCLGLQSPARAADTVTVSVSAVVVSGGFCRFWPRPNPTRNLNFGTLDPANPVDVTVNATLTFFCIGFPTITWAISDDDGLYETGPDQNRMRNTTFLTEFIRYSFDVSPRSGTVPGPIRLTTVTLTATVRGVDYQDAAVGNYSDVVTLTLLP